MNFMEIALNRQSCRSYEENKAVEKEKLDAVLEAGRLAPSACNGQPYHFTVVTGEKAKEAAKLTRGPAGMNKFAEQAPVMLIISEEDYVKSAGLGAKVKNNDYRSMDIGIACAYLTSEAAAQGLSTCILGWFDDEKVRALCGIDHPIRLMITLGYAREGDALRAKKRKAMEELVSFVE
ncbi:MAG: nitroreductase family protein [Clostridia bacterium]|nr:nitroreductase family protein [Clostridia bacterium]